MYIVKINFRFKIILDVNGDKYLDAYELEAIFQYELDKIYSSIPIVIQYIENSLSFSRRF